MPYPGQTEHVDSKNATSAKDPAMVALGHKGGLVGGPARAQALTPEQRTEIATRAAEIRWQEHQGPQHTTHTKTTLK
jgi:hypothetical protein